MINCVGLLYARGAQRCGAVHLHGARRIAEAATSAGAARLLQISAIGADPKAKTDYARTKGLGEAAALQAFPDTTVLRPSIVFGPEDDFFNRFAGYARISPALPLINGGHTRFQPVYVGDVADAALACLGDSASAGQTYELGGPEVLSFRELMEYILRLTGRARLLVPVPESIALFEAGFLEMLPVPPLTRDQVMQLRHDNVVAEGALTLADLGLEATPMGAVVPQYLARHRRRQAAAAA